jgi:asparagine synthase (glutamine-hydrolysing)
MAIHQYIERVVDLTETGANHIYNMSVEQARQLLLEQPAEAMLQVQGSFALLAKAGKTVRMVRSLDRPMRYFLAKRQEGPALVVASRVDSISGSRAKGWTDSFIRVIPAWCRRITLSRCN